jgi:S-formylglutathione hydrolase FrmB
MQKLSEARAISLILLALFLFFDANAQKPQRNLRVPAVRIETYNLHSKLLARDVSYRVVLPVQYDSKGSERFPVIYLLHGLDGHFNNWTDKTKLAEYASGYNFIIVTPEGGDGWYTDSATNPNERFETYITQEFILEIEKKFRTKPSRYSRAIAGLSMGGYGAIKFGLKYPEIFSLVGSLSGALDVPMRGHDSKFLRPSIISVFGEPESQTRKDNDIFRIVHEVDAAKIKSLPFIYFACGTEDWLFKPNRDFADLLQTRKIPHEFRELPGIHDWNFWNGQIKEFLRLSEKFLK